MKSSSPPSTMSSKSSSRKTKKRADASQAEPDLTWKDRADRWEKIADEGWGGEEVGSGVDVRSGKLWPWIKREAAAIMASNDEDAKERVRSYVQPFFELAMAKQDLSWLMDLYAMGGTFWVPAPYSSGKHKLYWIEKILTTSKLMDREDQYALCRLAVADKRRLWQLDPFEDVANKDERLLPFRLLSGIPPHKLPEDLKRDFWELLKTWSQRMRSHGEREWFEHAAQTFPRLPCFCDVPTSSDMLPGSIYADGNMHWVMDVMEANNVPWVERRAWWTSLLPADMPEHTKEAKWLSVIEFGGFAYGRQDLQDDHTFEIPHQERRDVARRLLLLRPERAWGTDEQGEPLHPWEAYLIAGLDMSRQEDQILWEKIQRESAWTAERVARFLNKKEPWAWWSTSSPEYWLEHGMSPEQQSIWPCDMLEALLARGPKTDLPHALSFSTSTLERVWTWLWEQPLATQVSMVTRWALHEDGDGSISVPKENRELVLAFHAMWEKQLQDLKHVERLWTNQDLRRVFLGVADGLFKNGAEQTLEEAFARLHEAKLEQAWSSEKTHQPPPKPRTRF